LVKIKKYSLMNWIIKKILLKNLNLLESADLEDLDMDRKSYTSGYSNGFVHGFFVLKFWLVVAVIILILLLFSNILTIIL